MNTKAQIERRECELKSRAARLDIKVKAARTQSDLNSLEPELKRLEKAWEDLDREKSKLEATQAFTSKVGHNYGNAKGHDSFAESKAVGRQPTVLDIPEPEYKGLFDAVQRRQPSYRINTPKRYCPIPRDRRGGVRSYRASQVTLFERRGGCRGVAGVEIRGGRSLAPLTTPAAGSAASAVLGLVEARPS